MESPHRTAMFLLFAEALEYPTPSLAASAKTLAGMLAVDDDDAGRLLRDFSAWTESTSVTRMEEVFTETFDLQAVCSPYAGYQLFGEDYARGAFMAALAELYRPAGLPTGNELPDHVSQIARYLASPDIPDGMEIVSEGLLPALEKMVQSFGESANPYRGVLDAFRRVCRSLVSTAAVPSQGGPHV